MAEQRTRQVGLVAFGAFVAVLLLMVLLSAIPMPSATPMGAMGEEGMGTMPMMGMSPEMMERGRMPMAMPMAMGPMFALMTLSTILTWLVVIVAAVLLIRWLFPQGRLRENDALEIARLRYARGEIGAEEYQRLRRDLKTSP